MGPFAAQKEELLSILSLNTILLGGSMFYVDLFYHISEINSDKIIRLCLECSSEIRTKRKTADKSEVLRFLKGNQLSAMIQSNGVSVEYTYFQRKFCTKFRVRIDFFARMRQK